MKIENPELLKSFHSPGRCECCGKGCMEREPHHIFSRGTGQIDIPENLLYVGTSANKFTGSCHCHLQFGVGRWNGKRVGIVRVQELCLERSAERCSTAAANIRDAVKFLRRLDKDDSPDRIMEKLQLWCVGGGTKKIMVTALEKAGKLA